MINIIYKDQKDLVFNKPKDYLFTNERKKKEAINEYKQMIKNFISSLPEKYCSVIELYEEIKDNNNVNIGLACLLYINILENEEILNDYYNNGLKHKDKEKFIRQISKMICKKHFDDDSYYDKIYDENIGFLKIYTSIHAIKEYNRSKYIIPKPTCIDSFYNSIKHSNSGIELYNFQRRLIKEMPIFKNNKIFYLFNNLINKLNLGIYEQIYLSKYLDKFSTISNDEIHIDKNLIIPYINFIKNIERKDSLYYLHEIKNITLTAFDELVNNGHLTYNEINELLMFVYNRMHIFKEITADKVLKVFNTEGIHSNFKLCKEFMYEHETDIFFDTKHIDILYSIKNRYKEEIELCIKILNTIIDKMDIDRIMQQSYNREYVGETMGVERVNEYWCGIKVGEKDIIVPQEYTYYESENYKIFLERAKDYNKKNPNSPNINLEYCNITDFKKEYLWKVYQYITKINNFILNNNIIDNFTLFIELLDSNENVIESNLSTEIKQMLINEGYLKIEVSYQLQKKYKNVN